MGIQMFNVFSAQIYHLPALNASVRITSRNASWSRKLSSAIVQTTSRTIMKVRTSNLKILNMKTRKATTNIRSAMTRRRPTHITTKHCETRCAPMLDCSSITFSAKNATTTSKSAKNVTTTLSVKNATTTSN